MRSSTALLLLLLLTAAAQAEVVIEEIKITWSAPSPDRVDIKVVTRNTGSFTEVGPIRVELFVRARGEVDWRPTDQWELAKIPAGHRIIRDYLPAGSGTMDPALYTGEFETRALVTTPDGRRAELQQGYPPEVEL